MAVTLVINEIRASLNYVHKKGEWKKVLTFSPTLVNLGAFEVGSVHVPDCTTEEEAADMAYQIAKMIESASKKISC